MSLSLKEILSELAQVVGRHQLLEHIDVLPVAGADEAGETESEKAAKDQPLTADEQALLAKLQARVNPQPAGNTPPATAETTEGGN